MVSLSVWRFDMGLPFCLVLSNSNSGAVNLTGFKNLSGLVITMLNNQSKFVASCL